MSQKTFCFTEENIQKAHYFIKKYPSGRQQSAIKALLDLAQRQNGGWLSGACIEYVAQFLNIPAITAMEVASFYTMFHLKPVGKHHVKVCGTTPCWLRGADQIKATCRRHLDIDFDQMTTDGFFSLEEVECLGACVNAPVIQVNDDYFEDLDEEKTIQLLNSLSPIQE